MKTQKLSSAKNICPTWGDFLNNIRHNYRHRILKAEEKIENAEKRIEPCSCFTKEHY
jgi:hypothetical protein